MLIDPESAVKAMNINKKNHWRDVKKVIDRSEVIVMVLDARDPEGTRAEEIESLVTESNKKIVYVINKVDLVPPENAIAWIAKFKSNKLLCLPFKANLSVLSKSESQDIQAENGSEKLMNILFKYAKKFAEKKEMESITVGVIGMPNVGKSSVINVLKNKPVCASGSTPFNTKAIQEVKLNSMVTLLDCPSILL